MATILASLAAAVLVTSMAFGVAMVADFIALPAAHWIFFREKPSIEGDGTSALEPARKSEEKR